MIPISEPIFKVLCAVHFCHLPECDNDRFMLTHAVLDADQNLQWLQDFRDDCAIEKADIWDRSFGIQTKKARQEFDYGITADGYAISFHNEKPGSGIIKIVCACVTINERVLMKKHDFQKFEDMTRPERTRTQILCPMMNCDHVIGGYDNYGFIAMPIHMAQMHGMTIQDLGHPVACNFSDEIQFDH